MSLTGKKPGDSYVDLLQMDNSNSGVDSALRVVKDGEGTATPLLLSDSAVQVSSTPTNPNDVANKAYVDSSGMSFISETTLSGTATDITWSSASNYRRMQVILDTVRSANANDELELQFYVNSSLISSAAYIHRYIIWPAGSNATGSNVNPGSPDTKILLSNTDFFGSPTDTNLGVWQTLDIIHSATGYPAMSGNGVSVTDNNVTTMTIINGVCLSAGYLTGVRFTTVQSATLSGRILIYGIK